jgi:hypothetical protein
MDTYAFDKFWATVAPLGVQNDQSTIPPHYPTFFTSTQPTYLSSIPRENPFRQFASLWFVTVFPWIDGTNTAVDFWGLDLFHVLFAVVLLCLRPNLS